MWKIHFWISNFCISSFGNLGNTWLGHNAIESECINFQSLSLFFFFFLTECAWHVWLVFHSIGLFIRLLSGLGIFVIICRYVLGDLSQQSIKAAIENVSKLEQKSLSFIWADKKPYLLFPSSTSFYYLLQWWSQEFNLGGRNVKSKINLKKLIDINSKLNTQIYIKVILRLI